MARRYTEVEPKLVAELVPGDQVVIRRTAQTIVWTATTISVTWDDGTTEVFQLDGDPAIEVVKQADG